MSIPLLIAVGFVALVIFAGIDAKKKERMKKLVPHVLGFEWVEGRKLRQQLASKGLNVSYGLFYLTMGELVEEGVVEFEDRQDSEGRLRSFRIPH